MNDLELQTAVLGRIAYEDGIDFDSMNIGAKGAVFYWRNDELLCWGQQGSEYWNELEAKVITSQVIANAARN